MLKWDVADTSGITD